MPELTLAQLADATGLDLGRSAWVTLDQDRIDAFAEVTEDRQWIHVDPERARSGPFGTTVAHGYLTLSLVSRFLLDLLVVTDAASSLNYGLDRVRFPAAVPSGARIRGRGQVLAVRPSGAGVQVTVRVTIECDATDKPAAVADVVALVLGH